jgi:coenzyme F420-reducing hydrogenase delta subunit
MVKAGLSAVGITQERVAAVFGSCGGCEQRQEALNEFGKSLGIGRPDGTPEKGA